ncbi:MAG: DUF169 domain-containing protein [Deltaproteobacteria bacterium]|nr:DUF169 domain-containing protein [Deltaproteobacteria bacterium]
MESLIARATGMRFGPTAILFSHERPEGAKQFKEGKWGCVMFMLGAVAKGSTAVFDRKSFGCPGGGVGLGFGNQYKNFPGGEDCFTYFLSVGNASWGKGRDVSKKLEPFLHGEMYDNFVHGERYIQSPELVEDFIENLPITDVPFEYVVFKPLKKVDLRQEVPEVIVFFGDMDQISALSILANYGRRGNENVIFPFAAGCQNIGIYPFREGESEHPRAVLGLNDISARVAMKRILKDDVMTFATPFRLFEEMERHVPGSFLERETWKQLMSLRENKSHSRDV